jgi:hypothetical protein
VAPACKIKIMGAEMVKGGDQIVRRRRIEHDLNNPEK